MLHKGVLFLLLGCIAIFTGDAVAGAYYEDSYEEYRPRRSYRKPTSQQPRYYSPPSQQYSSNRAYKQRNKRQYRPISSYKRNFLPERIYIGASIGHTSPIGFEMDPGNIKKSPGSPVYGVTIGVDVYDWLRVGVDITHNQEYKVKDIQEKTALDAQIKQTAVMLNQYFTLPQYLIKPYALLGIGLSWNSLSNYRVDGQQSNYPSNTQPDFAYQVGGGITFPYKNFSLDGEIKYTNKGAVKTKSGINSLADSPPRKAKLEDFVFTMSARYYFNDIRP